MLTCSSSTSSPEVLSAAYSLNSIREYLPVMEELVVDALKTWASAPPETMPMHWLREFHSLTAEMTGRYISFFESKYVSMEE